MVGDGPLAAPGLAEPLRVAVAVDPQRVAHPPEGPHVPREIWAGGPQTNIDINDFESGGQGERFSSEGSVREPSRKSKFFTEGDGEAKDTSRSGKCKISKRSKIEKCVDCFSAHGTHSEKKCDTWAKAREGNRTLTLSIPTMLILTFRILCVDKIGSRAAAACISLSTTTTTTTTTTKISAPGRLQIVDFPPPCSFSLRNPQRRSFGKNRLLL